MTLTEPMTMSTDYLLALLCAGFGASLVRASARAGGRRVGLWAAAYGVLALAALAGGTAHGFRTPLGDWWPAVWRVTVWSIALGSLLSIAAGIDSIRRSESSSPAERREGISWVKRAIVVSLVGLVVLVAKVSIHRHFNQNDLYHVIQMIGLYCLYRGAILLHGLTRAGASELDR